MKHAHQYDDLRRAGRFEAALAALSGDRSARAALERARCFILLGRPGDAQDDIDFVLAGADAEERAFALSLAAMNGAPPPSLSDLATAGRFIDDAVYYAAFARFRAHDLSSARGLLQAHTPSSDRERARYLLFRGAIKAAENDYVGQAQDTIETLAMLRNVEPTETYLIAFASYVLAALVREIPILPSVDYLADVERNLDWTAELNRYRFQLLRTLGWRASISGRVQTALTHFARSGFYATTSQLRAFAHLDRAESAAFAGEHYSAAVERTMAIEALDQIQWDTVADESIAVLPTAARVLAGGSYPQALAYAELAEELAARLDPRWSFAHGPRLRALINEGISFASATSDQARAVQAGRSAYETFEAIGYSWRAIRIADHLYALSGQHVWRERAARLSQLYPGSVLLDRNARPMTPRQAEIAKRLCGSETIDEIAQNLGVSASTVKTLAQRVYARTGARDRRELRRALMKAG